jgi:hypothetical protein
MGWAFCTNGEERNAYRILVRKPEGKIPLGNPRCKWVGNIEIDLGDIGLDGVDRICLAHDRHKKGALVIAVMNLRVP